MSTTAHFSSRAVLSTIQHHDAQQRQAARRSLWLSRLALRASGLLPVLVPPLLGYAMLVCMLPG